MTTTEVKIYSPNYFREKNITSVFFSMMQSIWGSRELTWRLFVRDIKAKYKQSLLGWLWLFVMPFVAMATFLLLNISGVLAIGDIPVPYPIFGLLGISLWQIFSNGWGATTGSLLSGGTIISKVNFPREALVLASLGQVVIEFIVRLALVFVVYLLYGLTPSFLVIFLPLFVLPLFLITLGLGFFTSILNVIVRDTGSFISLGTSLLLFLMPIMYLMPQEGFLGQLNRYNPLYLLVNTPREIVISGGIAQPTGFLAASLGSLIVFLVGWLVFHVSQSKLSERI